MFCCRPKHRSSRRSPSRSPSYERGKSKQSRSRSPRDRVKHRSRSPYSNRSQSPSTKSSSYRKSSSKYSGGISSHSLKFHTSMAHELMKLRNARQRAQEREAQRTDERSSPKPSAKSVINTPDVIAVSDGTPSPTPNYRGPVEQGSLPNNDPHHNGEHSQGANMMPDVCPGPRTPPSYDYKDGPDGQAELPREPPPGDPYMYNQPPPLPTDAPPYYPGEVVPPPLPQTKRASLAQLPLPPIGSDQDSDMDIDNSPDEG